MNCGLVVVYVFVALLVCKMRDSFSHVYHVTHADESLGSKAFIRVCLCVCLSARNGLNYNH